MLQRFLLLLAFLSSSLGLIGCNASSSNDDNNDNKGSTVCTSITAPSWDHPWPMFHGFETHTGSNSAVGPQNANSVKTFTASSDPGNPPNSIAIAKDGTIYLAGGGKVYSLTGALAEHWHVSYSAAQGPALSADGTTLYFGSQQSANPDSAGEIVAVNTSDGSQKWTYVTGGPIHFGPTVGPDGTVYQGSWDKYLYALNPTDGSLKWKYLTNGAVSYPPSILNCADSSIVELVILGAGDAHEGPDCYIYAIKAATGELSWAYNTQTNSLVTDPTSSLCDSSAAPQRVGSPAISSDGLIYAPAGPTLFVLDSAGTLKWSLGTSMTENFGIISPAVASDGTIYQTNSGGPDAAQIYAVDPSTHDVKTGWPYAVTKGSDNGIPSFPVVDKNGTVYFGDVANKSIYAVDKNGSIVFSYATGDKMAEAAPALVNGILYISSDDGKLYVIGP